MSGRSSILVLVVALLGGGTAEAAPKAKGKPTAAKPMKPIPKAKKAPETESAGEAENAERAPAEAAVQAAGTAAAKETDAANVKVKEDKEGVKTYKFETVEVEGRLKSPQVIYFLRRVRAEFDASALGHRSFLGELSDSRRSAALR